jgi:hypothetical protein
VLETRATLRHCARQARKNVRGIERLVRLGRPIETLKRRPADAPISRSQLEDLHRAWANPAYQADLDYLELVCDHAMSADAPVLECGSGLTTILLALTAGRRGMPVWSLEHDVGWYRSTRRVLAYFRLRGINLCHAPLVRYGGYAWYEVQLPLMPGRFGLVVCDGPPGSTLGGRGGLMPVMWRRLLGATILVDDAERPSERAMLAGWADSWAAVPHVVTTRSGSQVAAVRIPNASHEDGRGERGRRSGGGSHG